MCVQIWVCRTFCYFFPIVFGKIERTILEFDTQPCRMPTWKGKMRLRNCETATSRMSPQLWYRVRITFFQNPTKNDPICHLWHPKTYTYKCLPSKPQRKGPSTCSEQCPGGSETRVLLQVALPPIHCECAYIVQGLKPTLGWKSETSTAQFLFANRPKKKNVYTKTTEWLRKTYVQTTSKNALETPAVRAW